LRLNLYSNSVYVKIAAPILLVKITKVILVLEITISNLLSNKDKIGE